MLAYILAIAVFSGSLALFAAAFLYQEVHKKDDFILSGLGLFYGLVLWVCAGRITGGVLLGQTAAITLLGWFTWETLKLRKAIANPQNAAEIANFSLRQWTQRKLAQSRKPTIPKKPPLKTEASLIKEDITPPVEEKAAVVSEQVSQSSENRDNSVPEIINDVSETIETTSDVISEAVTEVPATSETVEAKTQETTPDVISEAVSETQSALESTINDLEDSFDDVPTPQQITEQVKESIPETTTNETVRITKTKKPSFFAGLISSLKNLGKKKSQPQKPQVSKPVNETITKRPVNQTLPDLPVSEVVETISPTLATKLQESESETAVTNVAEPTQDVALNPKLEIQESESETAATNVAEPTQDVALNPKPEIQESESENAETNVAEPIQDMALNPRPEIQESESKTAETNVAEPIQEMTLNPVTQLQEIDEQTFENPQDEIINETDSTSERENNLDPTVVLVVKEVIEVIPIAQDSEIVESERDLEMQPLLVQETESDALETNENLEENTQEIQSITVEILDYPATKGSKSIETTDFD